MRKLHKHKIIHTIFGKNLDSIIKDAFSPELFRKEGHKLIDQMADYLSNCYDLRIEQAIPWSEPDDLLAHWQKKMSGEKMSFTEIVSDTLLFQI